MNMWKASIAAAIGCAATAALAQLVPALPNVGVPVRLDRLVDPLTAPVERLAQRLADARTARIDGLVRRYPRAIERDPLGFPARRGEVLATDPDEAVIAAATARGFRVIARQDALGVSLVRFAAPPRMSLRSAIRALESLGAHDVSADQIYESSGTAPPVSSVPVQGNGPTVGMIDGGAFGRSLVQRGFAAGAPRAGDHGTAVASLLARAGSPAPRILLADVYGSDPAGGSASAIAAAAAWLVSEGAPVITISLVGPPNPALGRVVAAAQARGTAIVAAVGNDGPAAPPSYPASYPGVIAVTGVDARKRILIEAGRATHLDYAAPGADMLATNGAGTLSRVRGTSFAAPLVAATLARAYPLPRPALLPQALTRVDAQAERLGPRYGRGLVCAACPLRP